MFSIEAAELNRRPILHPSGSFPPCLLDSVLAENHRRLFVACEKKQQVLGKQKETQSEGTDEHKTRRKTHCP